MPSTGSFPGTCGVLTLTYINKSTPEQCVETVCRGHMDYDPSTWEKNRRSTRQRPFVTFSGVVERGPDPDKLHPEYAGEADYCNILADYIEENGLGTVMRSTPKESWTTNTLVVYVWEVDWDGMRRWDASRQRQRGVNMALAA